MRSKTSWKEKMDKHSKPEVIKGPEEWNLRYGGEKMTIPTPRQIESIINSISKGKIMLVSQLKEQLCELNNADYACPLTTGIFLRIVSEYAMELQSQGAKKIPPYWRIVKDDLSPNEKLSGGADFQMNQLKSEGFQFELTGTRAKKWKLKLNK
ncbi:MAG TPA: hypothetical protein PK006_02630 [Saprospiraceae bacterium]|nr:hypothetical protein [Saprospiraceae bacterium]